MTDSQKLDVIISAMQGMETRMQGMETRMQGMETQMQGMETRMQGMEKDLQEVKQKVTNIDLTLENEIRVNIRRVAEGHLDISRNLHDALKIDNEKEMIVIRVNILESELRRIKERLDQIA